MKTEKESVSGLFSRKTDSYHLPPSYGIYFLIIFCLLITSCSLLPQPAGPRPDSVPLYTEEIFTDTVLARSLRDARAITGKQMDEKEILEAVNEITKERTLYFYSVFSTDEDFQRLKKEVSVIRSAEEYEKAALAIIENSCGIDSCGEKNLVFLSAVKQLLIKASIDAGPLAVKIEELIREKGLEDDSSMDSYENFFDIMELEAEITHLKKAGRQLSRAAEKIERFISAPVLSDIYQSGLLSILRPATSTVSCITISAFLSFSFTISFILTDSLTVATVNRTWASFPEAALEPFKTVIPFERSFLILPLISLHLSERIKTTFLCVRPVSTTSVIFDVTKI